MTARPGDRTAGFGLRLRQVFEDKPFRTGHIAFKLGVSIGAVTAWKRGETLPSAEHLFGLADLFGCDARWLLLGDPA